MIRKPCCSRFSLHKFVHLKYFWTKFKNVHLRGPCSSRPCISRPYCTVILVGGQKELEFGINKCVPLRFLHLYFLLLSNIWIQGYRCFEEFRVNSSNDVNAIIFITHKWALDNICQLEPSIQNHIDH